MSKRLNSKQRIRIIRLIVTLAEARVQIRRLIDSSYSFGEGSVEQRTCIKEFYEPLYSHLHQIELAISRHWKKLQCKDDLEITANREKKEAKRLQRQFSRDLKALLLDQKQLQRQYRQRVVYE